MDKITKDTEIWLLKSILKIEPSIDGRYWKRIDSRRKSKLNDFHAKQESRSLNCDLFGGLDPSFYDFDYCREVGEWKDYNQ